MRKVYAILLIGILLVCLWNPSINAVKTKKDDWWNTDWEFRKEITIDHNMVSEDLENFPILFHSKSYNFSAHAQHTGYDFAFVSSDDTIQYNHEIEYYSYTKGELIAWVNITSLSSTVDTVLYVYYGNPSSSNQENIIGTWDSDFVGVWHCNNIPGYAEEDIKDSTFYYNHGTTQNMEQEDLVDGKISGALNFGGIDEKVLVYDSQYGSLDLTESLTLECWWNAYDLSDSTDALMGKGSQIQYQYEYRIRDSEEIDNRYSLLTTQGLHENSITHSTDTWYYGTVTLDSENIIFYNDGIISSIHDTTNPLPVNAQFGFGAAGDYIKYFEGKIDEVRVSKISRSSGWVETSYNTMYNPDAFLTLGSEESRPVYNVPPNSPLINGPNQGKPGNEYDYTFRATDPDDDPVMYFIDWGDDTNEWTEFSDSGEQITLKHTWSEEGNYIIKAKAKDINDAESDWTEFEIEIPRNREKICKIFLNDDSRTYFLIGRIRNYEIIEYEGNKYVMGLALHVRGIISSLLPKYPNLPIPIIWIWQKFCIPYKDARLIGPNSFGNYLLIAMGNLEF
ncbi:MAG: hypothetical protein AYK22_01710 [Thermoplasmatales archaeon SG8-52-3]|nr:MAG: hypothetical protein AYK22_01710 [Thermoplasmatales archaeon SG8-52-3]